MPDVVGFADVVPSNQIIGHNPVDEQRKLTLPITLAPPLLPIPDHGLNGLLVLVGIRSIRFGHGRPQKGSRRQLLRLVHPTRHLHLNPARGLDGHFLEIGADGIAKSAAFFHVGQTEREDEREKTDHHDGRDDLPLEAVRPAPEFHGVRIRPTDAPSLYHGERDRFDAGSTGSYPRFRRRLGPPGHNVMRGVATKTDE